MENLNPVNFTNLPSIKRIVIVSLVTLCFSVTNVLADRPNDHNHNSSHDKAKKHDHKKRDHKKHDHNENPIPPDDDPSRFTGPYVGDLEDNLPDTNLGAFEGGVSETAADAADNNSIPEDTQRTDGTFNIPTNGAPSPLYGALPFSQQMLRFA